MFINYTSNRIFASKWDAYMYGPSDCVWIIPGTFDRYGNPLTYDLL